MDAELENNTHGTHVAGITGAAPDAQITAYKVLDDYGAGYTSDIIAGLEAAGDPANPYRADVVNLSLGGPGDGTDPLPMRVIALVTSPREPKLLYAGTTSYALDGLP